MYSKKSFGINTLSCNEGSMRFRPEWPWRARREKQFLSWWISTTLKHFLVLSASWYFTIPLTMTKKNTQLFWHWAIDWRIISWLDISPLLSPMGKVLVDGLARVRLRGFALAFDRLAKASTFVFNAKLSNCISEVSCSLLSFSLLLKSATNLFKPWESLTDGWEVSLFTDSFFWFPLHIYLVSNKL